MQHLKNKILTTNFLFNHILCNSWLFPHSVSLQSPMKRFYCTLKYASSHFGFRLTSAAFIPCRIKPQKYNKTDDNIYDSQV